MTSIRLIACALIMGTGACADSRVTPKASIAAGFTLLSAANYEEALEQFNRALLELPGDMRAPQYRAARLGQLEAYANLDPDRAKAQFFAITESTTLTPHEYLTFGGVLFSTGNRLMGLSVTEAGQLKYPMSQRLQTLQAAMAKRIAEPGPNEVLHICQALGYP